MRTALVKGKLVTAGPESPDVAVCPSCKGMVVKNPDHRSGLLPRKKPLGAAAPKPPLAIPPQPQAGASWLFPVKRSRKRRGGGTTYFYRHKRDVGKGCPRRYRLS